MTLDTAPPFVAPQWWRRTIPGPDEPVGAYVHVPFCARLCPFCPYNKMLPRGGIADRYFAALATEARRWVAEGASGRDGFTSLYVGGGTPTLYPDHLAAVLGELPVTGERAIEVLPTHATPARLDALAALGFTAVSVGVQSFSDAALRHLGRPHDASAGLAALRNAVGRFELVDADLILDVEFDDGQAGSFLADLRRCFELGVDQVSTYPLMRFGYTPFGAARADGRREHRVLAEATRIAADHGYERRSVWTFNRPSSASYTSITRRRFVGMGAGAASFLGRDFLVNHFDVEAYIASVAAGGPPIARRFALGRVGGAAYERFWRAYAGRLSPRAFDLFHDLERWVTHALIEPLWAEMLPPGADATPPERRRGAGALWRSLARVLERPI